jgi:hypothetical protein
LSEATTGHDEVRLQLIRADDVPPSHELDEAYLFGLQGTKQTIVPSERQADGTLIFDFSLQVKPGADPEHPVFVGRFASGPVQDRFVYLSWRAVPRGVWINRVKARLDAIDRVMFAQRRRQMADWSQI